MAFINFQPKDYFNTVLYTGNASTNAITGVGFQPDWLWVKSRSRTDNHRLIDVLRGTNSIQSNQNNAQADVSGDGFTSLDSDGFTFNGSGGGGEFNANSGTYAAWNWRAGNSQGSSNTDGTINTTYTSVNTTAGFSISTYTGNATQGATVGHGLGAAPKMIIIKSTTNAEAWVVGHQHMNATNPWDYYLHLHENTAKGQNNNRFGNVTPTASVFTLGNEDQVNSSSKSYVAYCFAEKKGFSKFGSYTGNGNADGAFIYCGFKPAFIMCRFIGSGNGYDWIMYDNKRPGYNVTQNILEANTSDTENTDANFKCDFLSNGFKFRGTESNVNDNGASYIYSAFAEEPLVSSNEVPATAR
tara:strand:- start:31 stop:1098 length:1068 start_codon:yes stop_codon:yes gene_type:complete